MADFECSVGVVKTGFWKAPEVLSALRSRSFTLNTGTKKADVYSYAMTCYEIVIRHSSSGDHLNFDYGIPVSGRRP